MLARSGLVTLRAVDRAPPVLELSSEARTEAFGRALGALLEPGDVVLLEGELGAGKTVLARGMARGLGVPPDVPVQSPTFGLLHELDGRCLVAHADLYRLGGADELDELGLDELSRSAVVIVEWGERLALGRLPVALILRLQITGASARTCGIEARSARGAAVADGLLAGPRHGW